VSDKQGTASTPQPPDHDDPATEEQDLQAVRLSKAMETAAAQKAAPLPLFGAPVGDGGAAADGVAPAPTSADTLSGRNATPTARSSRRRSSRLTTIKLMLPVVALLTVGYLVYWWYIHNRESVITVATPDQPASGVPMVTVNNFKYSSTDNQNRPYTIIADSAAQPQDKTVDTITLVRPQANFTLAGNHWMTITAQNGFYHRNADTVDLQGNVTLDHDNGMTFHTKTAQVDMKAKVAAGSDPVQGNNATTNINSQGFRILDDGDVIIFTGKTLLKLHDNGKDGSE
jgi:lipopolysaccharide export system protein LptC